MSVKKRSNCTDDQQLPADVQHFSELHFRDNVHNKIKNTQITCSLFII